MLLNETKYQPLAEDSHPPNYANISFCFNIFLHNDDGIGPLAVS